MQAILLASRCGAKFIAGCANASLPVTMHNVSDRPFPASHQLTYAQQGITLVPAYGDPGAPLGHCNFRVQEVLAAFAVLVLVSAQELPVTQQTLPSAEARREFPRMARQHGANPRFTGR